MLMINIVGGGVDFLEFGVASGVSLSYWVTMNKKAESRFYGFDTFEGLPEAFDRIRYTDPVGTFSVNGSLPNIDDHRAKLIKGLFQNTLSKFKNNYHSSSKRLIIHNDSDLYSSSLYLMTMLDELIITGTILIFDEFFCSSHEFKAFYDYTRSYNKSYKVVASTPRNGSRYIQVAIEIL